MKSEIIPVTVRLGAATNIARASAGALAKHASSTNSGRVAALAAAAKYFRCREAEVDLQLIEQGDCCAKKPARYMAERKQSPFTGPELDALHAIVDGADVWSPALARLLRDLEQRHPTFLTIIPVDADRNGEKPFFGALLTAAGKAAIGLAKGGAS